MGTDAKQFFLHYFAQLSGHERPYPWQTKLFLEIIGGNWPQIVDLPTGSGKTGVAHVWLLALAWSFKHDTRSVPRRLIWVVNRRVVVDQITKEVIDLRDRLPEDLRTILSEQSASGVALELSTLRGQFADSGDWSRDPTAPAILVGTVDMIGSRLLFRGYRAGPYHRPIHAGLLAVDSLIVNDEAHLTPAFGQLLEYLHARVPAGRLPNKLFRVMLLSATQADSHSLARFDHSLDEDLSENEHFRRIFESPKKLVLHAVEKRSIDATVWKLATEKPVLRTSAFIERPEDALALYERLREAGFQAALLTGTMRGYERDQLAETNPVFRRFLRKQDFTSEPAFLVATSAGEVGIDFSCERMITGLVEADRLIQRFGRLDRFGFGQGEAHVVFAPPATKETRLLASLEYLRSVQGDVSCKNLWARRPKPEARTETPKLARLEPWRVEVWAQTTYPDKQVWKIDPWLHGKQESNPPETEVAWRSEVELLSKWGFRSTRSPTCWMLFRSGHARCYGSQRTGCRRSLADWPNS